MSSLSSPEPSCLAGLQGSITKAFSSMVLMLKALQSFALNMRSQLFYEDVETVADVIHREMQASFLWLFQQVFACTPVLMVSVMLLFSDFTAFSASASLSGGDLHVPSNALRPSMWLAPSVAEVGFSAALELPLDHGDVTFARPSPGGDSGGRGGWRVPSFSEFEDEETWGYRANELLPRMAPSLLPGGISDTEEPPREGGRSEENSSEALHRLLERTVREMGLGDDKPLAHLRLDQEVVRRLIAPVAVELESDNYLCFDRTDLEYQEAIQDDPHNPLLLSNYAQFLYIVRRDFDRAEAYFHKALREDPTDGDILGRFATFLWLARKDKDSAERAYKAALAASPDNPYYTGSYAHFLWHSGDDEGTSPVV